MKKHEDCVSECDKAIRCNPQFAKAYMRRAESNYVIGTETSLQKALK